MGTDGNTFNYVFTSVLLNTFNGSAEISQQNVTSLNFKEQMKILSSALALKHRQT